MNVQEREKQVLIMLRQCDQLIDMHLQKRDDRASLMIVARAIRLRMHLIGLIGQQGTPS